MPEVIINGTEGRIEALYHHGPNPYAPMALILHHHPEHGGEMNHKATYALFRAFLDRGYNTLRFNFRGIGKSEGRFGQEGGELSDAASVLDWMQSYNQNASECWVGGISYGAWIGMQLLMRRPELDGFVSVSPPANNYDFTFLAPCPVSGLIIHGEKDTLVPQTSVNDLVKKLSMQRNIVVDQKTIPDADHLFTDKLGLMMREVDSYLTEKQPQKQTQIQKSRMRT
ncbi:MAG: alpha/beta hydrolase [Janthinobacterium lividum]